MRYVPNSVCVVIFMDVYIVRRVNTPNYHQLIQIMFNVYHAEIILVVLCVLVRNIVNNAQIKVIPSCRQYMGTAPHVPKTALHVVLN